MKMKKPSNFNLQMRNHQFPSNSNRQYTPRMLKDFLTDESSNSTVGSNLIIIQTDQHLNAGGEFEKQLHHLRRRSPSATISSIHAMVNALKNINFSKSSSSGSLSRRSTTICGGGHRQIDEPQIKRNLTIKDIIRWKSFRDFSDDADDKSPTSVLPSSPQYHCTTTTTSTSTATNSPRSSSGSSWCGSDFTAENFNLPCWGDGKSEEKSVGGEKCLRRVGKEKAEVGPKKKSPNSVMEITFEENWWSSSFDQTLERINLEKTMSTTRKIAITDEFHRPKSTDENTSFTDENTDFADQIYIEEDEVKEIEEKAILQLLNNVKDESEKRLVLDLFREEVTRRGKEEEMVRRVKEWINGEDKQWIGWDKKDVCVREMEKEYGTKLKEEQEELSMEIHNEMVDDLVDELLLHLIISSSSPTY